MPWTCPNGCHNEVEDFTVSQDEYREDTIFNVYEKNDKDLECRRSHKVYVGDQSRFGKVECSECCEVAVWEEEEKPNVE